MSRMSLFPTLWRMRRASTPSNAAEIAVPDQVELRRQLSDLAERMTGSEASRLQALRERRGCAGPQSGS